ncbi:class I SAM-dependent DNA methyltransferase [Streptomyces sp. enrichment culture]|uniref:class I SAM-dependent DNA methyltransferase n=1 Tax=Streptomyces sp. enrichment culture TaxID=1795815 RepID=UPI003F55A83C
MTDATDFLTATRAFYDTIAEDYADHFRDDLAHRPLERALLAAYADLVTGPGPVADLGCGPGRVTGRLAALGLDAYGLDLSESMLRVARRENPALRFEQGSMLDLDVPDGHLAGIVCWYSSIHTPVDRLPALFAGFHRALAPGAPLLLAFQAGEVPSRVANPFGHPVGLDFERRRPEDMEKLLEEAGFRMRSRTVRERDETLGEKTPQAFLIAVR